MEGAKAKVGERAVLSSGREGRREGVGGCLMFRRRCWGAGMFCKVEAIRRRCWHGLTELSNMEVTPSVELMF